MHKVYRMEISAIFLRRLCGHIGEAYPVFMGMVSENIVVIKLAFLVKFSGHRG